jgi:hypothetical protein
MKQARNLLFPSSLLLVRFTRKPIRADPKDTSESLDSSQPQEQHNPARIRLPSADPATKP